MTDSTPASSQTAQRNSTLAVLRADALACFRSTLADCSIPAAFARSLRCEGTTLHRLRATSGPARLELALFSRIFVVALGKAALPMLDALLHILPAPLDLHGVCAAPALPDHPRPGIAYFAAGHPLPNADSFAAARAALALLHSADAHTLVIFLISGGGSALCELPLDPAITLDETRQFHQALIGCGAPITELNTIRQAFSAVKGGRLAAAARSATQFSLFVSDVPTGALDALASGPTLPSSQTPSAVAALLDRYALPPQFSPTVRCFFERLATTPQQPGSLQLAPEAARSLHDLLLSTDDLARAAARHAASLGYAVTVDNRCDDWDYAQAAQFLLARLHALSAVSPNATAKRICLISTGEVTVTLPAAPGHGGRNQQFALEAARLLAASPSTPSVVLSAGTDGIDGTSPASENPVAGAIPISGAIPVAGAIVDAQTLNRASIQGLDPDAALRNCNTWPLFRALGDSLVTGATGNNLRDLRLLLAAPECVKKTR